MLRVQPNGARSWVFRFRRDGTPRRVTLGKPDAVKADRARAAALAFLAREKGGGRVEVALHGSGGSRSLTARHIVLATGSVPVRIPVAEVDGERIVDNEGALAFSEVPKRLGIIGAGVIGLEHRFRFSQAAAPRARERPTAWSR